MSEEKKKIEIVNGDGSNLEISHVYDHLNSNKPKSSDNKPKNIVIPKEHKNTKEQKRKLIKHICDCELYHKFLII